MCYHPSNAELRANFPPPITASEMRDRFNRATPFGGPDLSQTEEIRQQMRACANCGPIDLSKYLPKPEPFKLHLPTIIPLKPIWTEPLKLRTVAEILERKSEREEATMTEGQRHRKWMNSVLHPPITVPEPIEPSFGSTEYRLRREESARKLHESISEWCQKNKHQFGD